MLLSPVTFQITGQPSDPKTPPPVRARYAGYIAVRLVAHTDHPFGTQPTQPHHRRERRSYRGNARVAQIEDRSRQLTALLGTSRPGNRQMRHPFEYPPYPNSPTAASSPAPTRRGLGVLGGRWWPALTLHRQAMIPAVAAARFSLVRGLGRPLRYRRVAYVRAGRRARADGCIPGQNGSCPASGGTAG